MDAVVALGLVTGVGEAGIVAVAPDTAITGISMKDCTNRIHFLFCIYSGCAPQTCVCMKTLVLGCPITKKTFINKA